MESKNEATKKVNNIAEKIANLNKIALSEKLLNQKGRSIYKKDFLIAIDLNDKKARRKARNLHSAFAAKLISDFETKAQTFEQSKANLKEFYSIAFENSDIYTNKSDEKREILDKAHSILFAKK